MDASASRETLSAGYIQKAAGSWELTVKNEAQLRDTIKEQRYETETKL